MSDLDTAIMGHVKKGLFDALTIVKKLTKRPDWPAIVTAMAEDLALQRAQDLIRAYRHETERKAEDKSAITVTEASGKTRTMKTGKIKASDIAKAPVFIRGKGFKSYGECTGEDFHIRGEMYEKIAGKATSRAEWCFAIEETLADKGLGTFGELDDAEIPALPTGETLAAVMGEEVVAA